MPIKDKLKFKWRNSKQLQGVRSRLQAALNACTNGCYVEVGTTDLRNAIEVCLQAEYKEKGHDKCQPFLCRQKATMLLR